ncbi:long-chain-fatty-acid--CoA ligase [Salicibibacter kimchii]|uniref:Long-chain fatty acid--CoA ligase n=1 Tax=Salicibibacter kimchii TaxID=2099786 RepID=A0A345BWL2_9BACI|nr:long-chain fatty acid--CoA ligase [Salicibibacter kimchii]AXF55343.1 long-chain fatty acid--CoA ligase [Salicibibacter kimchii]
MKDPKWLKHYPADVNADVQIEERSLSELLDAAVNRFDSDISLEYNRDQWSYREVQQIADRLAGCLFQQGFKKGDRLSIMLPNCPQYIFSAFAVFKIGGIVVQTNPMYVERELEHQLNDTKAEFIICHHSVYERVKNVQDRTYLKNIIVVKENEETVIDESDIFFEDFLNTYVAEPPEVQIDPTEDIAVLQYTGGTTGEPKGVMLTHQNFINQIEQYYEYLFKQMDSQEDLNRVVLSFLPLFHIFGFANVTMFGFKFGYKQILLPRFEVETVLNFIKEDPPFIFYGVPTMFTAMLNYPNVESFGVEKINGFFCGSSPMPLELYEKFKKLMDKDAFLSDGYGLSEATSGTISNPYSRLKVGSIGLPIPRTEAKIAIETDHGMEDAPVGAEGEILVRGPQLMKGYWNKPEETEATLKDGWLHTGDIGYMDEEGYFYIVDRKKDIIIASGYNVYPREIEEVIYQIPEVREVIVIGLPDEYRGEIVKAFVSLTEGQKATEEEITRFCRNNLAAYKIPRIVEFREELPKSSVGKLLKKELRNQELKKIKSN